MSGIEFMPGGMEFFCRAALMPLGWIHATVAIDDRRRPRLLPKRFQHDRGFQGGNGMWRVAGQGPSARIGVQVGKQPPLGICLGRPRGHIVRFIR